MSEEVKKITEEQLESIQNLVKQINNGQLQIGQVRRRVR